MTQKKWEETTKKIWNEQRQKWEGLTERWKDWLNSRKGRNPHKERPLVDHSFIVEFMQISMETISDIFQNLIIIFQENVFNTSSLSYFLFKSSINSIHDAFFPQHFHSQRYSFRLVCFTFAFFLKKIEDDFTLLFLRFICFDPIFDRNFSCRNILLIIPL